ncbi:MAG: hypothetical protein KIC94_21180, partial [Clostridiales bacterium]|nr:hypothetical protein [Clostridiales bacterium]
IATNPDTFQTEEKTVVETYINKTTCIVKIIIQNEVIYTTMNHPFYVKGQGFVAAGKLSMGDEIMNVSGGSYPVESVELEERQEVVYNFQVEDYHTYYVGESSILVHNDCPEGEAPTEDGSNFSKASSYGIDIDNLNFSNTVQNHTGRPYQDSKLLINEIIESKTPVPDPRGTNALSWTGEGTFNGSTGYYELIIDPSSNTVWHFVFKSQ